MNVKQSLDGTKYLMDDDGFHLIGLDGEKTQISNVAVCVVREGVRSNGAAFFVVKGKSLREDGVDVEGALSAKSIEHPRRWLKSLCGFKASIAKGMQRHFLKAMEAHSNPTK